MLGGAKMGSGGDLGRSGSMRRFKRVNVRFKLPYMTHWGQNLMIVGSDALLGAWIVEKGQSMTAHHEGDVLVWQVSISVPEHFETEYNSQHQMTPVKYYYLLSVFSSTDKLSRRDLHPI